MAIDPATLSELYDHAPDIAMGGLALLVIIVATIVASYRKYRLREAEKTASRFRGSTPADDALRAEIPTTDLGALLFPKDYAAPRAPSRLYAENMTFQKL